MSRGEHIKAADDDTCLVEFRLTKFSSETQVKGMECSQDPPHMQNTFFLIGLLVNYKCRALYS